MHKKPDKNNSVRITPGDMANIYKQRIKRLTSELANAKERERRKIASDLHDRIGQNLALIKLKLNDLHIDPEEADLFEEIRVLLSRLIDETRKMVFDISPPILYKLGLLPAVMWLKDKVRKEHGLTVYLSHNEWTNKIENRISILCFRAIQELMVNAIKHSQADQIHIDLNIKDAKLQIVVKDNGLGCDPSKIKFALSGRAGFGLFEIQNQIEYADGRLEIEAKPEKGLTTRIYLPLGE